MIRINVYTTINTAIINAYTNINTTTCITRNDVIFFITDIRKSLSHETGHTENNSGKAQHNSTGTIVCIILCIICLLVGVIIALGLALFSTIMIIKVNARAEEISSIISASKCINKYYKQKIKQN